MRKIEHLGIAVSDVESAKKLFGRLLGTESYKEEYVAGEGVHTAFFRVGDTKIELLEATRPDSPIARFIEKKSEGIHHIAFDVEDIRKEVERLKKQGFEILNEEPKAGADNKLVVFLHPKSTNGVLVELCQDKVPGDIEAEEEETK